MDYVTKEQIKEMELEEACCFKQAKTKCVYGLPKKIKSLGKLTWCKRVVTTFTLLQTVM